MTGRDDPAQGLASMLASAAALLEPGQGRASSASSPEAAVLLAELGYAEVASSADPRAAASRRHGAAMLRLAARCRRLFRLPSAAAPAAVFFGAEIDPAAVGLGRHPGPVGLSGRGRTTRRAFDGCIGECAEFLSFLEWGDEPVVAGRLAEAGFDDGAHAWLAASLGPGEPDATIALMPARHLHDGEAALLPRDLCLRRPPDALPAGTRAASSAGCAAGPSAELATESALLELVERDAAALWWYGGRQAAAVSPRRMESWGAAALLAELRRDAVLPRRTFLLDVTTDIAIPAIVAVSHDADGRGLAFGFSAGLAVADAAQAALLELCQMELSQQVVMAKQRQGGGLNDADRRILRRMTEIDLADCPALSSDGAADSGLQPGEPPVDGLTACLERLAAVGLSALAVDLTRLPIGVPVARVVVPGLQGLPPEGITARLAGCPNLGGDNAEDLSAIVPLI